MSESLSATRPRPRGLFALGAENFDIIYGPEVRAEIGKLVDLHETVETSETLRQNPGLLADIDFIFSGWGAPVMDEEFLAAAPRLQAVFYAAGSVRYFTTEAFWRRGVRITSAYAANAVPVAEYALSAILLSLKHFWKYAAEVKSGLPWGDHRREMPGGFRSTVGLVSFGMISRRLRELLLPFDLKCLVYCPFISPEQARELDVELCSLEEIFRRADVVSLHTPVLPETIGLITGDLVASMKPGATLLNTARGKIIDQPAMLEVLKTRPDLTAVLDVTEPEPPEAGSPVLSLPNVVVTPHIAGSQHLESRRMGAYMLEELRRYLDGEPLKWELTEAKVRTMA